MARAEVTCYHEAGHVVIRLVRNLLVDFVFVWETSKAPGNWEAAVDAGPCLAENWVAGAATEHLRFGEYSKGAEHDLEEARQQYGQDTADEELKKVIDLLAEPQNWAAVERIAEKLLGKVGAVAGLGSQRDRQIQACEDELREWFAG